MHFSMIITVLCKTRETYKENLCNNKGLIAGVTYNIPVSVRLQEDHPNVPPMVYVTPTSSMAIRESQYVDTNGRVFHPYLHEWNKVCELWNVMCNVKYISFSRYSSVCLGWSTDYSNKAETCFLKIITLFTQCFDLATKSFIWKSSLRTRAKTYYMHLLKLYFTRSQGRRSNSNFSNTFLFLFWNKFLFFSFIHASSLNNYLQKSEEK